MSQPTSPASAQGASRCAAADAVDNIGIKLESAYGIVDLVVTLANTGDIESLYEHSLSSALIEVMDRINEARALLEAVTLTAYAAPKLQQALQAALVVVAGCNADGAFIEQDQIIRAALAEAEGVAA
ncbi:MAG: hypothetical protein Q7J47_17625 [Azoarcus sp.]|nr:hypothetical protein [Azoarcus sp.]